MRFKREFNENCAVAGYPDHKAAVLVGVLLRLSQCFVVYNIKLPMEASLFLKEIDRKVLRIIGCAPHGFETSERVRREYRNFYSGGYSASAQKPVKSSDGRWALGDRVYHDDQGYGSITQIREGEEGPVIKVVFETGHEQRFLSLHQGSAFTKIKED